MRIDREVSKCSSFVYTSYYIVDMLVHHRFFLKKQCNLRKFQQYIFPKHTLLHNFSQRRHLGWETENISGILHKYCVSLWIFLSFWNQWDPMQLPKSIWAKKSAVFSYLGSHMWDNTKIQKNEKYWPKMKMKNFPFFGQKSIIHS